VKSYKTLSVLALSSILTVSPLALAANATPTTPSSVFSTEQIEQVKRIMHDYLVSNPQVLVEASLALQKQEVQQVEQKAQAAIVQNANQLFADPASPVIGNPKGDLTIVEFFDYQCPHCKDMAGPIDQVKKADPNIRIVLKELPIFGNSSRDAAAAALASQQQGPDMYLKFHNALLAAPNPLDKDKIMQIAKSVGLDTDKLTAAMNSDAVKKQLDDNFTLAQGLGLVGTPTFIISKWQVGAANNSVDKAQFLPGVLTTDKLQAAITKAKS